MEIYLLIAVVLGFIHYKNGYSFLPAFLFSIIGTPIVGLIFVLMKGRKKFVMPYEHTRAGRNR